jgi:DnaJ-class molecular chaperone
MDYYSTLGINRNASQEEIKKAYKKMSMQHHPDRTGGDDSKFKEINEAYQNLSDPQKKQMYDQFGTADPRQQQYRSGDFEFNFNGSPFGGMDDIFESFFGGGSPFGSNRRRQTNRPINVAVDITLEDVLSGKTIGMEIQLPTGRTKVVTVDIPAGVEHGQQIRYRGMGEQNIPNVPPGDLNVQIRVRNHPRFQRFGDNILCEAKIDAWDLMCGTKTKIHTLDNRSIEINIPSGTQPDTLLSCKGEGLPNVNSKRRGNLQIRIKAEVKRYNVEQINKIRNFKDGI